MSSIVNNNRLVRPNISLEIPILPKEKLYPTPSMKDSLKYEDEFDLRFTGCELIQTSGRLLKLPQTAMATGQILFHRYFYCKSFVKNNMEFYAMASIYLSSKIEESPRTIRDVINVFNNIKQVRSGKIIKPVPIDHAYYDLKNQIIKAERRILKELGFCVHLKHPHKVILIYLTAMNCTEKELIQKAWNYMNDSLRTDVFLRYSSETVACACIYLSARELKIPLPTNPQWFTIFGADEDALKSISIRLMHQYSHVPKSQEELEKIVNSCKENLNQEKLLKREVLQTQNQLEGRGEQTVEIKTASTTPSSDISATTTTQNIPSSSTITNKINIINNTSINITNNHSKSYHSHYNHAKNYQYHQSYHHAYPLDSQQSHYYLNEYTENDLPYYRYNDPDSSANGVQRVKELSGKTSHKKHSRRHSSRNRSRSRTRSVSRSISTSPKQHKRHKKRSSRDDKYRSKSRSRSASPSKHKKKKYHHKSRSKETDYNYDSKYKNVLV